MSSDKIPPFDYLKGSDFTHNLKNLTNCKDFHELSELVDVPKSTFSTWNTHDRTSHELMVRLSLALNIPLAQLALAPANRHLSNSGFQSSSVTKTDNEQGNPQHQTVILKSYCLANGKLIDTGEIPYPARRINSFGLEHSKVVEVETNDAIYLVDKAATNALAGKYLIDIDGMLSINHIQRLPNKLAVVFGNSTVEVSEEDIRVIGRVAVTLKKD